MRTTFLPPHLAAQTIATEPVARPQARTAANPAADGGFEALALKSAAPTRVIAPRQAEVKPPMPAQAPAPPIPQPAAQPPAQASAPDRLLRPGSRLDIRV